jgi:hypothetical protein
MRFRNTPSNTPVQCVEFWRSGFSKTRCTNKAVYGYYCELHGTPPQGDRWATGVSQEEQYARIPED